MRSKFNIVTSTILVSIFIARFGTFLVLPYLTLFLLDEFHYSAVQIGTVISTLALSNLIMSFLIGPYIDRFPKDKVIITGLIGYLGCYIYFPFIEQYGGFILFAALLGASQAIVEPTYRVLLSLYTEPENRRFIFNIRYFLINISAAIAPLTSVYFQQFGMENLFFVVGFIFFINIMTFAIIFKKYPMKQVSGHKEKPSIFQSFYVFKKDYAFGIFILALIFISFGYSQFDSTFSQYLGTRFNHELAIQYFAWLITTNAITVIIIQYFVYKLGEVISTTSSLIIGSALLSLGLICFGQSEKILILIAAMVVFTAGEVLVFTMIDIHIDGMCEDHEKGTYFALSGVKSIGRIAGPSMGGFLLDSLNSGAFVFTVIGGVTLLAIPSFYLSNRMKEGKNRHEIIQSD
ncbi:MFS transporter [Psychrobacillus lasiicapitis]|uniref:MFS transporter n=1 Tax=Psychrobacillus lasiicapitis TaxID=1636719 RepID=A0A544TCS0_9BACI|nr:MFS transporter [Psychrobacillus lasiicapitis]TQR15248.1 MFS transporter [Psychrobacillus lasiicapitis]GGA44148.1 MFS transporter [Psychrobacillus lasiicapitis]